MTLDCTWEEFKQRAKDFRLSAPDLNVDELENAWHCLGLSYLGMNEEHWRNSAAIVLKMESKTYILRAAELQRLGPELE